MNAAGRSFLWATHYCGAQATYPEVVARRAGTRPAEAGIPPYLVLLRVGFALPAALLRRRCALTAPFHPYLSLRPGRYVFCGTFRPTGFHPIRPKAGLTGTLNRPSRTLSGTLLCGVRTFLCLVSCNSDRPVRLPTSAIIVQSEVAGGRHRRTDYGRAGMRFLSLLNFTHALHS